MGDIEFELRRAVRAPIGDVFARLADIGGHNEWMPRRGSILRETRQTSPGPVGVGTTYEDRTRTGTMPGDVAEYEPPHRIVYHWWDASRSGKVRMEGWPGYTLEPLGDDETLVRHDARLRAYGVYTLGTPLLRLLARRERNATIDALVRSFDTG
jgi:uncharacterized protein YndB with AHSA1/START domain